MKPVLAVWIDESLDLSVEQVADLANAAFDREFRRAGRQVVSVRPVTTEEELRRYQAGELVLYRKPARRHGNKIIYEKDGVRHELEQLSAFHLE